MDNKYRWNLEDINKKKKYVMERLSNCTDKQEQEKLSIALISYLSMLDNSGSVRYTSVSNLLDKITKGKYTLNRDRKYVQLEKSLFTESKDYIDLEYLEHLITVAKNLSTQKELEEPQYSVFDLSEEQLVTIAKGFYAELGDKDIYESAMKQLDNNTHINFYSNTRNGWEEYSGLHFSDPIFNTDYCNIRKAGTLMDAQAVNHEVMHCVDSNMGQKLASNNYYGFHEVPTYTIDYLMFDYLERHGFDQNEVSKLREKKNLSMTNLASNAITTIYSRLLHTKGLKTAHAFTTQDILDGITFSELKSLIEVESYVMSYGLALQIMDDKEKGLSNLKQFMKTNISKDKIPDFSDIGLDKNTIIQLINHLGNQLTQQQNIQEESVHKGI